MEPETGAPTASCGLYLVLPENWTDEAFLKNMRDVFRALNASAHRKNNHVVELRRTQAGDADFEAKALALASLTRSQGVVFVVSNDTGLAGRCGADGILLDDLAGMKAARASMGDEAIIGVRCATDRDKAVRAAAAGADYVTFSDAMRNYVDPALVQWWSEHHDVPCLVEGRYTNDDCAFYVHAGAYLLEASQYVWTHPKGVMQGIVNMTHAIDLADGTHQTKRTIQ